MVGILREGSKKGLQILFFGKLRVARGANSEMLLDQCQLIGSQFAAGIKNQQRRNLFAGVLEFGRRHRSSPNWLRSFRVARKSEFLTVSSLVPRASPMARSFKTW